MQAVKLAPMKSYRVLTEGTGYLMVVKRLLLFLLILASHCCCISDPVESGKYNLINFTATQVRVLLCSCIAVRVLLRAQLSQLGQLSNSN